MEIEGSGKTLQTRPSARAVVSAALVPSARTAGRVPERPAIERYEVLNASVEGQKALRTGTGLTAKATEHQEMAVQPSIEKSQRGQAAERQGGPRAGVGGPRAP